MVFNAFGTRLQSLWIIFFARKDFPCGVSNRMQKKSFLDSYDFHFFRQHVTLTYVSIGFCQRTFSTDPWVMVSKRYTLYNSVFSGRLHLDLAAQLSLTTSLVGDKM